MFRRWFLDHPSSVGEGYFEHQRMAFSFSNALFMAAIACFIHGLVPGLFKRTASGMVARLHDRMVVHRMKDMKDKPPVLVTPEGAHRSGRREA